MKPKYRVIFFDFGSTLLYEKASWPAIYARADKALVKGLQQSGIPLAYADFLSDFGYFLDAYYARLGRDGIEKTTFAFLSEYLEHKGFRDIPGTVLRAALDAFYAITQKNWYLEADAIPTLATLQEKGYRLGMISNTSDDHNVQQLVDRHYLRPYFETILTSAGCGIRKPDERIFHLAMEYFKISPDQAVMVGDSLEADIQGANRSGIYSLWITRRVQLPEEGELTIQPQAVITALGQIPGLIAEIENEN